MLGDDEQLLVVAVACWTLLRASLVAQRAEVNRSAFDLYPLSQRSACLNETASANDILRKPYLDHALTFGIMISSMRILSR